MASALSTPTQCAWNHASQLSQPTQLSSPCCAASASPVQQGQLCSISAALGGHSAESASAAPSISARGRLRRAQSETGKSRHKQHEKGLKRSEAKSNVRQHLTRRPSPDERPQKWRREGTACSHRRAGRWGIRAPARRGAAETSQAQKQAKGRCAESPRAEARASPPSYTKHKTTRGKNEASEQSVSYSTCARAAAAKEGRARAEETDTERCTSTFEANGGFKGERRGS
eukprot:2441818-Pleurochrysis_carterae.AAC.2